MSRSEPRPTARAWTLCGLLFAAATLNYMDRQVLAVLKPTLQGELGWSEAAYGDMVFAFQGAYALGMLGLGRLVDRVGVRWGYLGVVASWSAAAAAHALASTAAGFTAARAALGFAEAGGYPAALKTVAQVFPPRSRAFATGLFNSGSNIGALVTPFLAAALLTLWGWRAVFVVTGGLGLLWMAGWLLFAPRERHERAVAPRGELRQVLRRRETWVVCGVRFLTEPVWWFLLFWTPDLLHKRFGLDVAGTAPLLACIYVAADVGSIAGGWLPGRLTAAGVSLDRARKVSMLGAGLLVVPVLLAAGSPSLPVTVGVLALAAAAHQAWGANVLTLGADLFPARVVATVSGLGGACAAVGGMIIAQAAGHSLQAGLGHLPVLLYASVAYLLAGAILSVGVRLPEPPSGESPAEPSSEEAAERIAASVAGSSRVER